MPKDYHHFVNTLGDKTKTELTDKEFEEFISLLCHFMQENQKDLLNAEVDVKIDE